MFGDVAIRLLKLMGHSGTVPSAILAEDIPEALERLRAGLAAEETSAAKDGSSNGNDATGEPTVSLRNRAFPLIELLESAARQDVPVRWES